MALVQVLARRMAVCWGICRAVAAVRMGMAIMALEMATAEAVAAAVETAVIVIAVSRWTIGACAVMVSVLCAVHAFVLCCTLEHVMGSFRVLLEQQ